MELSEYLELVLVVKSYNDMGWEPIFCYLSPQTAIYCLPCGYYVNPLGMYKQTLASENVTGEHQRPMAEASLLCCNLPSFCFLQSI